MFIKIAAVLLVLLLPVVGHAQKWRDPVWRDMFNQPSYKNQESPRNLPKDSVPIKGKIVKILKFDPRIDRFQNPVSTPTGKQLAHGKFLWDTYCFPCHGITAMGNGPIAAKGMPAPPLINDFYRFRSDAYLWATVLQGGPLMPGYAEAISTQEAWLVVDYIRSLQRQ